MPVRRDNDSAVNISTHLKRMAEAGFNVVLGSGDCDETFYNDAHKYGLLVLGGHYI